MCFVLYKPLDLEGRVWMPKRISESTRDGMYSGITRVHNGIKLKSFRRLCRLLRYIREIIRSGGPFSDLRNRGDFVFRQRSRQV